MRDVVNEALARYDVPSDVYDRDVLIDAACVCAADKIIFGLIPREEADARVAAALREAAEVCEQFANTELTAANPSYAEGYSDGADRCEHALLSLIPDSGAAFDRAIAKAEARGYKAGWQFAFGQWEGTGSVPDPDYDPRARTEKAPGD
jgi:hypothetical protein